MPIKTQLRKMKPRPEAPQPSWRYQVVQSSLYPLRLRTGEFSAVHERFAAQDPHIAFDVNITRMRSYVIRSFAESAIEGTEARAESPTMMFVGIAFGTAPLTTVELLREVRGGVRCIFVDPFDGRGRNDYNDDVAFVKARVSPDSQVEFVIGAVPECLVEASQHEVDVDELSSVHLNTGSIDSEIATFEWLHERLLPGAFMVWDTYGWSAEEKPNEIDDLLISAGVSSFLLPTGQLVCMKSRHSPSLSGSVALETRY